MFNIIKRAAIFTGLYFVIFSIAMFLTFLFTLMLNLFIKPFALLFVILVAVLTWDHYNVSAQIKAMFKPSMTSDEFCKRFKKEGFSSIA